MLAYNCTVKSISQSKSVMLPSLHIKSDTKAQQLGESLTTEKMSFSERTEKKYFWSKIQNVTSMLKLN